VSAPLTLKYLYFCLSICIRQTAGLRFLYWSVCSYVLYFIRPSIGTSLCRLTHVLFLSLMHSTRDKNCDSFLPPPPPFLPPSNVYFVKLPTHKGGTAFHAASKNILQCAKNSFTSTLISRGCSTISQPKGRRFFNY
jgi:hypothetical protein